MNRINVATELTNQDFDITQPETLLKEQPIIRALKSQKTGNSIEILAEYSGLKYNKKFNLILDNHTPIPIDHLLSRYGFTSRVLRCPHCMQSVDVLVLFQHLQDGFQDGHKFTHQKVIEFFQGDIDGTNQEMFEEKNRAH